MSAPEPGKVYSFDFKAGKLRPVNDGPPILLGQRVSYGDMANPRRVYVVVDCEAGPYGYRCVADDDSGDETTVSRAAIEGPGGWQTENSRATIEQIDALILHAEQMRALRSAVRIEKPSREYLTPAQSAAKIRAELKSKHGWTSRDISVRAESYSMGSSIHVSIKRPGIRVSAVKAIAETQEEIRYDDATGEILSGGNRYVSVTLDSGAYRPVAEALRPALDRWPEERGGRSFVAGLAVERTPVRGCMFRVYLPTPDEHCRESRELYDAGAAADFIAAWLFERFPMALAIAQEVAR